MPDYELNFSPFSFAEAGSYKLVELTPDLTTLIETAIKNDDDLESVSNPPLTRREQRELMLP
jgi:hypothetical protein